MIHGEESRFTKRHSALSSGRWVPLCGHGMHSAVRAAWVFPIERRTGRFRCLVDLGPERSECLQCGAMHVRLPRVAINHVAHIPN